MLLDWSSGSLCPLDAEASEGENHQNVSQVSFVDLQGQGWKGVAAKAPSLHEAPPTPPPPMRASEVWWSGHTLLKETSPLQPVCANAQCQKDPKAHQRLCRTCIVAAPFSGLETNLTEPQFRPYLLENLAQASEPCQASVSSSVKWE